MEPTAANLLGVLAVLVFSIQTGMTLQNRFREDEKGTRAVRWAMLGLGCVLLLPAYLLK